MAEAEENSSAEDDDREEQNQGDPLKLLSPEDASAFDAAVKEMANEALSHLTEARNMQSQIPKAGRPCVLLPVIPSLHYLWQLEQEKLQYNVFDRNLRGGDNRSRLSILMWLGRTWLTGVL